MSGFVFGARSLRNLDYVHPDLARVAHRALSLSEFDFAITEGLRSTARQRDLLTAGKSKTMRSRHLSGHAIDIVAFDNGKVNWNLDPYYFCIAEAFAAASREAQVSIVWGGCWRPLSDELDLRRAVAEYIERTAARGGRPLVDGVHFELDREVYGDA